MVSEVFIAEEINMCMITSARTACSHPCRSVVKLNNNSTIKIPFRLELEFFTGEVNNQLGGQRMKTVFTRCLLQCYSVTHFGIVGINTSPSQSHMYFVFALCTAVLFRIDCQILTFIEENWGLVIIPVNTKYFRSSKWLVGTNSVCSSLVTKQVMVDCVFIMRRGQQ